MSKELSYVLLDSTNRDTSSYKKAVKALLYVGNKKIASINLDYADSKSKKIADIEIVFTDYLFVKEVEQLEKQEARERKKREREEEKQREREEREFIRQQKEELRQQRELAAYFRKDLAKILKEEQEEVPISIKPKKEEVYFPEEIEAMKEARKELDKERAKLKRTIAGRIRLFLKEHLIDKLEIWDDEEKEEDFVKVLERMYGTEIKSLKGRSDEMNFKKFANKVITMLETFDSRQPPTIDKLMRHWMKRAEWEDKIKEKETDLIFDETKLTYHLIDEKVKYYYQKTTGKNRAIKIYNYEFDKQFELTANIEGVTDEAYKNLRRTLMNEIHTLWEDRKINFNKQFQVRLIIPQYGTDAEGNFDLVEVYTGGNGATVDKRGYGLSLPSEKFNMERLDNYVYQLMNRLKERLASYFSRNHNIYNQYISGFMITTEI